MGKTVRGKIKWYNEIKGYGFIETDNGVDVFIHRSGLTDTFSGLETGQEVEFETQSGEKGLSAINLKSIN